MSDEITNFNQPHVETGLHADKARLGHTTSMESASLNRNRILGRHKKSSEIQTSNDTGIIHRIYIQFEGVILEFTAVYHF